MISTFLTLAYIAFVNIAFPVDHTTRSSAAARRHSFRAALLASQVIASFPLQLSGNTVSFLSSVRALDHSISVTCSPALLPLCPPPAFTLLSTHTYFRCKSATTSYHRMCGLLSAISSSVTSLEGDGSDVADPCIHPPPDPPPLIPCPLRIRNSDPSHSEASDDSPDAVGS